MFDRELASDDRRARAMPIFNQFKEIPPMIIGERGQTKVIKHEQIEFGERSQEFGITPIATRDGEFAPEAGDAQIEDAIALTTGGVRHAAGHPCFSHSCGAGYQHIVMFLHPLGSRESGEQGFVYSPWCTIVEIF